jgi:Mrp family chromosome partitioning ATPase
MFDALRRAESERRRKLDEMAVPGSSLEPFVVPARDQAAPSPAPSRLPRRELATAPSLPPVDSFPREMLRELGILRNSLEAKLEKKTGRVLMFTSPMHGEGVTALVVAYARLLAMQGDHRVIVIELNARTPALAAWLGLSMPEGVTHYFTSRRPLASLVSRPAGESFDVMHVGIPDATQIQINLERAFPHLMEEALKSYDTVIIDAPPVVVCPETPPLSPFVDGVVLVVHSGRTKRETIDRSVKQIQQFQGRVLGVVLNRKRYYIPGFIYRRL